MSKFYDVISDLKRRLERPRRSKWCAVTRSELSALLESAELIYEVRNEENGLDSMPMSASLAIKSIEQCTESRRYETLSESLDRTLLVLEGKR